MEWRGAQLNGCQFTHGMVHCVVYTGVRLRTLLDEAGVKPSGKWLLAEGADAAAMTRSIPMEKALDDCMVAFDMHGEALRPRSEEWPVGEECVRPFSSRWAPKIVKKNKKEER